MRTSLALYPLACIAASGQSWIQWEILSGRSHWSNKQLHWQLLRRSTAPQSGLTQLWSDKMSFAESSVSSIRRSRVDQYSTRCNQFLKRSLSDSLMMCYSSLLGAMILPNHNRCCQRSPSSVQCNRSTHLHPLHWPALVACSSGISYSLCANMSSLDTSPSAHNMVHITSWFKVAVYWRSPLEIGIGVVWFVGVKLCVCRVRLCHFVCAYTTLLYLRGIFEILNLNLNFFVEVHIWTPNI